MDHGFTRAQEMWELSDGSIHILRELCLTKDEQGMGYVVKMLEKVQDLGYIDHFKHSANLKENLFKSLIAILKTIDKKQFRDLIEQYLDISFRNSRHQN